MSSPSDRYGTGGIQVAASSQESIAADDGLGNFVMTRGMGKIISTRPITITKPFLVTANDSFDWDLVGSAFPLIHAAAGVPLFRTLPLKTGDITAFADGTTVTNVASQTHNLRTGDTIKIIDSRTQQYLGNHVVTDIDANNFSIPVTFVNVDGFCRWEQVTVRVTTMADAGGGKTRLAMVAHPFQNNNWINVRNTTNGINGTFQISNRQLGTVEIDIAFPAAGSSVADLDVGYGILRFNNATIANTSGGTLWDMQGQPGLLTSFIIMMNFNLASFNDLGQTKDSGFNYGGDSGAFNCFGHKVLGGAIFGLDTVGLVRNTESFLTATYKSFIEFDGTLPSSGVAIHLGNPIFFEFQSIINYPTTVNPLADGVTMIGVLGSPSPGSAYKTGERMRATGVPTGTVGLDANIPVDNTEGFRVGDIINTSESSSMNTTGTSIEVVVKNTRIETGLDDNGHPNGATTATVNDNGDGTITFHAADLSLGLPSLLLVGDTIIVENTTPLSYRAKYKVLAVLNIGGTDPQVTVAGVFDGNISTQGTITGDAGILISNLAIKSQTQKDPQIIATANKGVANSITEGGFVATGTTTLSPLTGAYADLVFPATRTALSSNQRVVYAGNVNGEIEITGIEEESLQYPLTLTLDPSSAPDVSILIKLLVDKGAGYVDLPTPLIEQEVFFKGTNVTTTIFIHVDVEKGNKLKVQGKQSSGSTNVTIIRADLQVKS